MFEKVLCLSFHKQDWDKYTDFSVVRFCYDLLLSLTSSRVVFTTFFSVESTQLLRLKWCSLLLFLSCSHGQDHEWIRQQDKQTWKLETHVRRLRTSDRPIAAVQLWKMLFHLRVNRGARSYDLKKIRWRLRFWIANYLESYFVFVSKINI